MILLTLKELAVAATWAQRHAEAVHGGDLPHAAIAIRHFGNCGIGPNTLVMCETCDSKPGNAGNRANYHEVTDYEAW